MNRQSPKQKTRVRGTGRPTPEGEALAGLLAEAIECLPYGLGIFDKAGRFVVCNKALAASYGQDVRSLLGMSRDDFIRRMLAGSRSVDGEAVSNSDDCATSVRARLCGLQSGPVEIELANGSWRLMTCHRMGDGGQMVVSVDTTKLKHAEIALRDSEGLIRRVLEACPVPIRMVRVADGKILYESPASRALYGETSSDPETRVLHEYYVNPGDRDVYMEKLLQQGSVDGYEMQLKRVDGSEFCGAVSSRLIDYLGEKVVVSSTYDLTERKTVESEMSRQREALHRSEKLSALGELLAGVAHELNNPLSVVVGQSLLLKDAETDQRVTDRAVRIADAAERCARIVKTFLAMARQQPAEIKPVDIHKIIGSALGVTSEGLRASNISVNLNLADAVPPVAGDADQLNQVITNLILNARQALLDIPGERRLTIATAHDARSGDVVLEIADNGPGVPAEIRSRIFEPFFTTKKAGGGTGIGLAMSHRIATAHGGSIALNSGASAGATFELRLPVSALTLPASPNVAAHEPMADVLTVLVVDDEADVAEVIADILESEGCEVEIAQSGQGALEALKQRDFDVILSDIRMPGLDGRGLYREIEQANPHKLSALAFITGDTLSRDIADFLEAVGRPYIEKPITPESVRRLVKEVSTKGS